MFVWKRKTDCAPLWDPSIYGKEISPLLGRTLNGRGFSDLRQAIEFLEPKIQNTPQPFGLPNLEDAATFMREVVSRKQRVFIVGDRDVDGTVASHLLSSFLKCCDVPVRVRIPSRVRGEGYGLSMSFIREALEIGAEVLITVDCGITSVKEVEYARQMGLKVLVTDHHEPEGQWPSGAVNPKLEGCQFSGPPVCGAAVAWYLIAGTRLKLGQSHELAQAFDPWKHLSLVAIATIADVMDLGGGANRILTRAGLEQMSSCAPLALDALWEVAGGRPQGRVSARDIAFRIAPRINAAGRVGDPETILSLLGASSRDEALRFAWALEKWNARRRELENEAVVACERMIEERGWAENPPPAIVVGTEGLSEGVVGIAAGRLAERFDRPTVVLRIANGKAIGSGRSVPGVNLLEGLRACRKSLGRFGGHSAAAGLELDTNKLGVFTSDLNEAVKPWMARRPQVRELQFDDWAKPEELSVEHVEDLGRLEPVGEGSPPACFAIDGLRVKQQRTMGAEDQHVSLTLQGIKGGPLVRAVVWRAQARWFTLEPGCTLSVIGEPSINAWKNRRSVQLELKDFRRG